MPHQDPTPLRVSFVCTGNICRSPMAEAVLRHALAVAGVPDGAVVVDSFGTGGWHVGRPADPRALAALRGRGYDIAHSARLWQPRLLASRDLVVALDRGHVRELRSMAPSRADAARVRLLRSFDPDGGELDVPDPYTGGAEGFEHALDLIEAGCAGLVAELRGVLQSR